MLIFALFVISGVGLLALTLAKRFESKNRRSIFILKVVSKVDERARKVSHEVLHFYSDGKHKFGFFVKKQLPLKAKIHAGRAFNYFKAIGEERFGRFANLRGSREIQKPENISEFFKNIAEVEKGAGVLHDDYPVATEGPVVEVMARESVVEIPQPAVKTPRKRAPRRKKIEVVEVL